MKPLFDKTSRKRKKVPSRILDGLEDTVTASNDKLAKSLLRVANQIQSIDPDLNKIKDIATRLKRKLGICDLECRRYAHLLHKALKANGFDSEWVLGYIIVDGNYDEQWGSGPVSWWKDDKTVKRNMDHYWVVVEGVMVDIGCDQFNPLIKGKKYPLVFIGKDRRHKMMKLIDRFL